MEGEPGAGAARAVLAPAAPAVPPCLTCRWNPRSDPLFQGKHSQSLATTSPGSQSKETKRCALTAGRCRLAQLPGEGANFLVSALCTGEHK